MTSVTPAPQYVCRDLCVDIHGNSGPLRILSSINLEVRKGEFLSILGHSGAGKTTLLRALSGLVRPTDYASLTFNDSPVTGPPNKVVTVFQDYTNSLLPWRTVAKNVALGLEGRAPRAQIRTRVDEALEMVGLAHRGRDYCWQLSGGMQQRVQIARALALEPEVLLMDEPFGALDAMTKASLQDQLQRVQQRTGATIIFVTHDIDEAVYMSDRIVMLTDSPGRIGHDIQLELPRPRDQITTKEQPEYLRIRHTIYRAFGRDGKESE